MTDLTDLVRSELTTLADSGPVPTDLADRAVTAGVRRRRWRRVATAGTAVAAAVAVTLVATQFIASKPLPSPDPRPAAPEARNVVFARFRGAQTAEILNPTTGGYRTVSVLVVMEPSADLRYAPVVPPDSPDGTEDATPTVDKRIGRYDTTTGEIRWYDAPYRWAAPPSISPDGRYLVAPVWNAGAGAWAVMVVDAETGDARVSNLAPETVDARNALAGGLSYDEAGVMTVSPRYSLDIVIPWLPDSRHVLIGTAIVDLDGRRTGTVPIRDEWLIAQRPNGAGALVVPRDALDTYVLTDPSGADVYRRRVDRPCTGTNPTACSLLVFGGFLGWRGPNHMLVKSPEDPGRGIDAIDVRTGERTRLTTYDAVRVIVAPADALSPPVRDAVSF
ncbi:hypothetical protein [Virgisporangium aurantiacum]|uniref:Uncharacterized protein n=1 Tax=Virgisporangium aurantiacum TaxID=175570 RepID=A0A8J4E6X7_9ACTN|nr:hypothetical protein [Virgisporangium aurantiacum]GIJ63926.1 hypothetical protein Vau01_114420 [Virgisporangium aurantiacum]